jgi:hypothetical protein
LPPPALAVSRLSAPCLGGAQEERRRRWAAEEHARKLEESEAQAAAEAAAARDRQAAAAAASAGRLEARNAASDARGAHGQGRISDEGEGVQDEVLAGESVASTDVALGMASEGDDAADAARAEASAGAGGVGDDVQPHLVTIQGVCPTAPVHINGRWGGRCRVHGVACGLGVTEAGAADVCRGRDMVMFAAMAEPGHAQAAQVASGGGAAAARAQEQEQEAPPPRKPCGCC